jgi:MFS family permease
MTGCTLQAAVWLPILLVPVWFDQQPIVALLVLLVLYHSAHNLSAPQWTSIMRDLVSERRRGRYFGHRTRLTTITTFVSLVVAGLILHLFDIMGHTYIGFVVVFLAALLARAVSVYHLSFLHEPATEAPPPDLHVSHWLRGLVATGAVSFSTYYALMNAAVGISAPFFTVYMLRDLELSYLAFMILTGTSVFTQFLTLANWGRIADVYGNRLILFVTSMSLPVVPLLWLVTDNFWYLIACQAVSGFSWSGFTLASGNLLYELVPRSRRAAYVALHNVATASGVFGGAMLGAALVLVLPTRGVFVLGSGIVSNLLYLFALSGILRAAIAALLVRRVREIRKPRKDISPRSLVMRITGFSAMLNLLYDFIGRPPPGDDDPGN